MKSRILLLIMMVGMSIFQVSCVGAPSAASRVLDRMNANDYFEDDLQVRFVEAVARGNERRMRQLFEEGADVNVTGRQGMRPILWAFVKRSPEGLKFLLENGAEPNIRAEIEVGKVISPIEIAAIAEDVSYLRLLLKHGADPNTGLGTGGRSVIWEAVMNGRVDNVRQLIEAGANLSHQDTSGQTAMMTAAFIKNFELVYLFLQKGADPQLKNAWNYDLSGIINRYGDAGVKKGSEQHRWYFKVVEELRRRGLLEKA